MPDVRSSRALQRASAIAFALFLAGTTTAVTADEKTDKTLAGGAVGAAGGALQTASRTMMVHQANPARIAEAFGLYALAGKATSFIAPLSIGAMTYVTGSQQLGVSPLIALFLIGLLLLVWVKPNTD